MRSNDVEVVYLSLFREVLLYPYRAHRAGVGGVHGQRHLVGRNVAGDGDGQSPLHLVYLGAEPGTLGADDSDFRVYECFHVGTTSIQNEKKALRAVWPGGAENML